MPITKSQVKYIQSLAHKKFRDAEGVFVVEGPKIVAELLQASNLQPRAVYALPEWIGEQPASLRSALAGINESELERLSALTTPNQVVAVLESLPSRRPSSTGASCWRSTASRIRVTWEPS